MTEASTIAAARRLYRERRDRDHLLGGYAVLMGEPAWDMLLELFVATDGGPAFGPEQRSLVAPALVAQWSAVLRQLGLVERRSMVADGDRALRLSAAGLCLMNRVVGGSTESLFSGVDG